MRRARPSREADRPVIRDERFVAAGRESAHRSQALALPAVIAGLTMFGLGQRRSREIAALALEA